MPAEAGISGGGSYTSCGPGLRRGDG